MIDKEQLIEAVTREVLQVLAEQQGRCPDCPGCTGCCAADCCDRVRKLVDAGAESVNYSGNGAAVPEDLARYIDHTMLKPEVTADQIDALCDEALEFGFASVCVNPTWVQRCADRVRGSTVRVASVIGFPLGATSPEVKAMEARQALRHGAREIDMVLNVGALKSGDHALVRRDIAGVSDACREVGAINKVILETVLLSDEEKVIASRLAREARAHYVKTSTGFNAGGATAYDVALMREAVGPGMGVKASGGIRTADDVRTMIAAGATRIGASAGVAIVSGGESNESY